MITIDYKEVAEVIDLHERWLDGDPGGKQGDFSSLNLRRFNFSGRDLRKADFKKAVLYECDFKDAILDECDMRYCDLKNAFLFNASLKKVRLDNAILDFVIATLADFSEASLRNIHPKRARFKDSCLDATRLTDLYALECDFTRATFKGALINGGYFDHCFLKSADMGSATVTDTVFADCQERCSCAETAGVSSLS